MENTKLYFKLERDFNSNIELIVNNHIDLENYLNTKFNIIVQSLDVNSDECIVKLPNDNYKYIAEIKWITHI